MNTYPIHHYGRDYRITADDAVMEWAYARGEFCEEIMLDWIVKNIPHGGIWVDCGANAGNHSMVFATACEAEVVMAFEPVKFNCDMVERNMIDNGITNVIPIRLGVGLGPELMGVKTNAEGRNSQFSLSPSMGRGIPVVSLDAIVPHQNVRLLKIDVEGAEQPTLWGARAILATSRPEIFVEILERPHLDEVFRYLQPLGYALIERYNDVATYFFSASGRYKPTYTEPK